MLMASISPDLHALNCKNCSQMVNWILVELENDIFLVFGFWLLGFSKKKFFLLFPNENYSGFHMRYHLFLYFIRTNMHTTVVSYFIRKTLNIFWCEKMNTHQTCHRIYFLQNQCFRFLYKKIDPLKLSLICIK